MSDSNPEEWAVTERTKQSLWQAAPWLLFLAVMGYIGCGALAVGGLAVMFFGGMIPNASRSGGVPAGLWPVVGVIYIGFGLLWFFPTQMLRRLASRARKYGSASDTASLEGVALNVRSLARYWGVLMIVILSIYALIFLVAVAVGMVAAFGHRP